MRSVSEQFLTAITQSHRIATLATVTTEGGSGDEFTIPIADGSVTLDQTAQVRGTCDITVIDDGTLGLIPTAASSLLAPYGNELRLYRGITYPLGNTELVSLGRFGIQDVDVDEKPEGTEIKIVGLDRSKRIQDARFEEPYQVTAGTNYADAIAAILSGGWVGTPMVFTATALTAPQLVAQEGDDRWAFAQEMAKAISMTLYFDGDGVCRLAPAAFSEPVAELVDGENGVLLRAQRRWTREGAFNGVIATGENTGETAPARGVARDLNDLSPTYYYGPFGQVPRFYSSPFLTDNDQAEAAASAILARELGTTQQLQFGTLVLAHLEPSDTVRIHRERAGIEQEDHVIDSLQIPFTAGGSMSGQTRKRQVT